MVAAVDTDCTLILPAMAAIKLRFRVSKLILGFFSKYFLNTFAKYATMNFYLSSSKNRP